MSLKHPFLWRDTNKNTLKDQLVLPDVNKNRIINTDFMINTKIKGINDHITVYDTKIAKMMNMLRLKEEELMYKEKALKEQQRKAATVVKGDIIKKQFNVMEDDRKAENAYEKRVKEVSQLASYNLQNRQNIESLRKEKSTYKQINEKLEREIDNLKRNYGQAGDQLSELTVNRQTLEKKIDEDMRVMEKDKALAVTGLLTIQQKLTKENKKLKNNFNMTKKSGSNPRNVTFHFTHPEHNDQRMFDSIEEEGPLKNERLDTEKFNETKSSGETKFAKQSRYTSNTLRTHNSKDTRNIGHDIEMQEDKIKRRLEDMENLFKVLYEVTSTDNVYDLTDYYLELEEENKELYKGTKLLIEEMDKMKDQKLAMQLEIKTNANSKDNLTNIKHDIIGEIETKVDHINGKVKIIDQRREHYAKLVNELKLSLPVILKKLAFEGEQVEIAPNTIDKQNLSQYLYVLERKTNYILKLVKENNLETHIFDPNFQNSKDNKVDELKWKNDLNILEDLLS